MDGFTTILFAGVSHECREILTKIETIDWNTKIDVTNDNSDEVDLVKVDLVKMTDLIIKRADKMAKEQGQK